MSWIHDNGYIQQWHKGRRRYQHRVVWENRHGPVPKGMYVHHVNGDRQDNRIENLECISPRDHMIEHTKCQMVVDGLRFKLCNKCKNWKPWWEYSIWKGNNRPGSTCKKCCCAYQQDRRARGLRKRLNYRDHHLKHGVSQRGDKKCSGCNRILPKTAFNLSLSEKSGLRSRCRECTGKAFTKWYKKRHSQR